MKKIIILSLLAFSAFAGDEVSVARVSATAVEVTETKAVVTTENIDDIFRQIKVQYEEQEKEVAIRKAIIAKLWDKVEKAKTASVEPTSAVEELKAQVEAAKAAEEKK